MPFILHKQRHVDVVTAFRNYRKYLSENKGRFLPLAYELASSEWYFDPFDHRCPHDAWLESATLLEPSKGERNEIRTSSLTIRLLGAYHDGFIELEYPELYSYRLDMAEISQGHGDWRYDEFWVNDKGHLVHEIEWRNQGSWLIEASDVHYRWLLCSDS
jgi:hypothetical protein